MKILKHESLIGIETYYRGTMIVVIQEPDEIMKMTDYAKISTERSKQEIDSFNMLQRMNELREVSELDFIKAVSKAIEIIGKRLAE